MRFDERVGPGTRIKYLTDGMLVREMMADPLLLRYDVVVVDEAHERTLRTDVVLASLKQILAMRNGDGADRKGKGKANPLKVVIMSATLDAEKFSKFFEKCIFLATHTFLITENGTAHPCFMLKVASTQYPYSTRLPAKMITSKLRYVPSSRYTWTRHREMFLYFFQVFLTSYFICLL